MLNLRNLFLLIVGALFITNPSIAQVPSYILSEDGTWCWFSDPRAIVVDGDIISGWVKANGTIEAVKLNIQQKTSELSELYNRLEVDDHNNPAFTTTENGKVLSMYTRHSRKDLFINSWNSYETFDFSGAQLIHPWTNDELEKYPVQTMTYANPYRLKAEQNRIYAFGRWTGFKPNIIWSDDHGKSWSPAKVFITNIPFHPRNRPYVKYYSDGVSKIHMVFTDGHPRLEATNSVYYAYYENGAFYRAGGDLITTLEDAPFEPNQASVVYTSTPENGRAWIADISADDQNRPVILYTRSPTEQNHEYWYARFIDGKWTTHKIVNSGGWFPETPEGVTEREPHYFGGMTNHPGNADVVYLSREVDGVFEIERWETSDYGKNWEKEAVTQQSTLDNVRPYVPRGLGASDTEVVLWMENKKYIHYTDYRSAIRYALIDKKTKE